MILSRNRVLIACGLIALAGASVAACTTREAGRELKAARLEDRPATIRCLGYHGVMFIGRSTGAPVYDVESGRLNFVDAATGALVASEGECIVVSDNNGQAFTIDENGQVTRIGASTVQVQPPAGQ